MPRRQKKDHPLAMRYAKDVISGRVLACRWVKRAVARHLQDLERAEKGWDYYFDEEAARHACDFFPMFLRHSKGEWAGQPFVLEPWQEFIIWTLFGWQRRSDDTRRFRTAYIEVARKNGKSTLAAGVGLYLLDPDNEPGAEVYTAATKREQARIIHSEAVRMRDASPFLRRRIGKFRDNLHVKETASKFEPLGADSGTLDGLNVHGAIIDELHAHKTRDMVDVLETATGARRQPLIFIITTAGSNRQSICWEYHEYTEKVLKGIISDETFFGIIYDLDDEEKDADGKVIREADSWEDESVWIKANPNLGISVKVDDLKRKVAKAKEALAARNALLRLHFNKWTQAETRWLSAEKWRACGHLVDPATLKGRRCYGGLDLSSKIDLSAFVLVFPPERDGERYQVLCRFWIPSDNMRQRSRRDRVPYEDWVAAGFITATMGNVIDYDHIFGQILRDAEEYDLQEVAFDRWGAEWIRQKLEDAGITMVEFGQGYGSMNAPSKELEKMVLGDEIAHGNHPVLTWQADNVVVKTDPAGNIKPDKAKSYERIDGIVALIMALDRAMRNHQSTSVYEERGVLVF